jgi:ribonuclease D
MDYTPLTRSDAILALAQQLQNAQEIALDTEADSLYSYRARVCLIQVGDGTQDWIVDPLSPADLKPLLHVLEHKPLLLHGCDYDLRMMRQEYGFQAQKVYDTMIGGRYLNLSHIGYAALVQAEFGVELDKSSQKADWSRRPIPDKMLEYAAQDTHFLHTIAQRQRQILAASGKLAWVEEHCQALVQEVAFLTDHEPDPDAFRIKGSSHLRPRALGMLKVLWNWRELRAKEKDVPSFKVLGGERMIEWAMDCAMRRTIRAVDLKSAPRNFSPDQLDELAQELDAVLGIPESELPQPLTRRVPPPAPNPQVMEKLKTLRDQLAIQLQLDPSLAGNRQQLVNMAFGLEKGLSGQDLADLMRKEGHWMQWQQEVWEPLWKTL